MQFIKDNNEDDYLIIDRYCSKLKIKDKDYIVTKTHLFTEKHGKFETNDFIIKYSKNKLYLYKKSDMPNIIYFVSEYDFDKFINLDSELSNDFNVLNINKDNLLGLFYFKKDTYIHLYDDYIKVNDVIDPIKSNVKNNYENIITTVNDNELILSLNSIKDNRYNRVIIGKNELI